jgi:hypothetical protein
MQRIVKTSGLVVASVAGLVLAGAVRADTTQVPGPCSSREAIVSSLAKDYREAPVSVGMMANGNLMQIFASPDTRTWTIISTAPDGMSCVMAAGKSWEIDLANLGPAA